MQRTDAPFFSHTAQRRSASPHHRIGTSMGIHPEDQPWVTDEQSTARIEGILLTTEPDFLAEIQCGRTDFQERSISRAPITGKDAQHAFEVAAYETFHSALWRYGYLCGWNHAFYAYAVASQSFPSQPTAGRPRRIRREEER